MVGLLDAGLALLQRHLQPRGLFLEIVVDRVDPDLELLGIRLGVPLGLAPQRGEALRLGFHQAGLGRHCRGHSGFQAFQPLADRARVDGFSRSLHGFFLTIDPGLQGFSGRN